jgi:hypothetical protein
MKSLANFGGDVINWSLAFVTEMTAVIWHFHSASYLAPI